MFAITTTEDPGLFGGFGGFGLGRSPKEPPGAGDPCAGPQRPQGSPSSSPRALRGHGPQGSQVPPPACSGAATAPPPPSTTANASYMAQPGKNNNYTTADMESLDDLLSKVCPRSGGGSQSCGE